MYVQACVMNPTNQFSVFDIHPLVQYSSQTEYFSSSTSSCLVDLLVRKPLARLQILLLERRIQHA